MAIISTKGTLDWAYPPLILASSAAAMGWEVGIFFTFYGLNIIHKNKKLMVAPLGNPAMPMPVPNLVGAIPGMTQMATTMMKKQFKGKGVASIDELMQSCIDLGVRLMPCQMTVDVFGYKQEDFLPAAEPGCGAAAFIRFAADADVSLFV
ncbi:MAG TPA: DsrE/DsrF/DrsH-like family protein [Candidatus Dormibacteraeota bacterium]|nr:DsrE/DsrF/DrsH-like family protein [Candidatus Dormibacteraeota bacterium]